MTSRSDPRTTNPEVAADSICRSPRETQAIQTVRGPEWEGTKPTRSGRRLVHTSASLRNNVTVPITRTSRSSPTDDILVAFVFESRGWSILGIRIVAYVRRRTGRKVRFTQHGLPYKGGIWPIGERQQEICSVDIF
jgi:hypothetical protein